VPACPARKPGQTAASSSLPGHSHAGQLTTPSAPDHRWEPATTWWPQGVPAIDEADAQDELARRWLARFGPATVEDLQWWTGWTKTNTSHALSGLPVHEVDLHGQPGIALTDFSETGVIDAGDSDAAPVAALLPALDPTPMGWKHRDWFSWHRPAGDLRPRRQYRPHPLVGRRDHRVLGRHAVRRRAYRASGRARPGTRDAVDRAAARLYGRLNGAVVTPAVRIAHKPLPRERRLSSARRTHDRTAA
jgi:Winged helix DNA-binding domain